MKINIKNYKVRNYKFVIAFLAGLIIMLQLKSEKDDTFFFNRENIRELELQIVLEKNESNKLKDYQFRKTRELEELSSTEKNGNVLELLSKQKRKAMSLNGLANFEGPGIKIELKDSEWEILANQNPNDYVVHDQDVLSIVNDLKVAGAEAISINNQILKLDSVVKCSGATITINGKTFAQPFVIRAIGDVEQLEAAIKSKDSYAFMIESLYGIVMKTKVENSIKIAGDQTVKNNIYLKEAKE